MSSSFQISRRGARDKVKTALAAEVASPEGAPQQQIKAAVAYVVAQIDALPTEYTAVHVTLNGDASAHRSVIHNCTVTGEKLDL